MGLIKRAVAALEKIANTIEKQKSPFENYAVLIEEASKKQATIDFALREEERNKRIREKYDYYKWRIEKKMVMTNEQQRDFEFVKFKVEGSQNC
jgi:hypothetical protein